MGFALSDMTLTSTAFDAGGPIPKKHTGEAEDVSPALSWSGAPEGTKSFALICHDPDAPLVKPGTYGFVHWALYGIPGSATGLVEGAGDFVQGNNDFGSSGYGLGSGDLLYFLRFTLVEERHQGQRHTHRKPGYAHENAIWV